MSNYLFIYGTLHPDRAPRAIADAARKLTPVGPATIRGRLLDLGEYPGLVLADATDMRAKGREEEERGVSGHVFEAPDAETLAALDAYEDYRPDNRNASLFLRVEAPVTLHDGSELTCWVYVYNVS